MPQLVTTFASKVLRKFLLHPKMSYLCFPLGYESYLLNSNGTKLCGTKEIKRHMSSSMVYHCIAFLETVEKSETYKM